MIWVKDKTKFVMLAVCVAICVNLGTGLARRHHLTPEEQIAKAGGNVYDEERHKQNTAISDQLNMLDKAVKAVMEMKTTAMKPLAADTKAKMNKKMAVLVENNDAIKLSDTLYEDISGVMRSDEADEFDSEYTQDYSEEEKRRFIGEKYAEIQKALNIAEGAEKAQVAALYEANKILAAAENKKQVLEIKSYIDGITATIQAERNKIRGLQTELKEIEEADNVDKMRKAAFYRHNLVTYIVDPGDATMTKMLKDNGFERERITALLDFE